MAFSFYVAFILNDETDMATLLKIANERWFFGKEDFAEQRFVLPSAM
ncbi:hypothetical protein GCM10007086_24950 [Photobacterium aphoticum]|nr:hypothetical protein GCM10007086_24950 [Photobacterium aphoticum]